MPPSEWVGAAPLNQPSISLLQGDISNNRGLAPFSADLGTGELRLKKSQSSDKKVKWESFPSTKFRKIYAGWTFSLKRPLLSKKTFGGCCGVDHWGVEISTEEKG